jgi:hypothetical protein
VRLHNFVRIHQTLRTTPAMAAGVTKRLWEIGDVVDVLESWEAHTARKGGLHLRHGLFTALPTARDVNVTPLGSGAMVCDPEQDYWRVSPHSSICRRAFCKGPH